MNEKDTRPFHYAWIVLAMGTFAVFGALGLARFGYTTVLPAMQKSMAMDNAQAGLLATANLAGYLILSIIGGALASRYGARSVVTMGLLLAGAGMIFTGLAEGLLPLAVWRCLTGIGSGAGNIAVMGLWAAWFSRKKRGLASGIAVSGSSIALIVTGIFVPAVIAAYGINAWRICWFGYGVITLILAVGSFLLLRNNPSELQLEPVGTEASGTPVPAGPAGEKINWRSVYGSASVWHLGLVYIAFGFSYIIYMTFFSKFLINNGYTQASAGNLFMTMGWFSLLCGLLWGSISDRIGRKNTLIILYLIHAVAFSLFAIGKAPLPFTISAILFGLSAWSIPAIMAAACGDILGPQLAPAALGFVTLFFGIGQAAGPYAAGAIADAKGSFAPVFVLAAGIALVGAIGAATLKTQNSGRM
jgi:MFS family permease